MQEGLEVVQLPGLGGARPPELARVPLLALAVQTTPPAVIPALLSPTLVGFHDPLQKGLPPLVPPRMVVVGVGPSTILLFLPD